MALSTYQLFQVGAVLFQSGASVSTAHEAARMIVAGFGADVLGLRSGYTSLEITVGTGRGPQPSSAGA